MATESGGSIKPVAVVIVGADALLAARPATAIQLWHACVAAGYDLAVPATWGDELIAAECLRAVGAHAEPVTVMCSCPMVARAIAEGDPDLADHLVSLVAPPVATARYLRRVYGDRRVHITYVGACPAAGDSAIDAWITPPEMLERFTTTGIDLASQPQLFESVLPPDRRRHVSQPGGLPTAERAAALPRPRRVVDVADDDVMGAIRRYLMSAVPTLVDVAPRMGCACSGVTADVAPGEARLAVTLLEPPRSTRPVMAEPGGLALLRRAAPRPVSPKPATRAPDDRASAQPEGSGSGGQRDRERIVATPRTAARSPLSWNLRERALPQPPTSGGRAEREAPSHGASSGGWGGRGEAKPSDPQPLVETRAAAPTGAGAPTPDPVTAAAIRALEAAGREKSRVTGNAPPDSGAVRAGAPRPEVTDVGAEAPATPDPNAGRPVESWSAASGGRPTPPGGYWFIPERAAQESDAEVERAAAGVGDGPPDDVTPRSEQHAEVEVEAVTASPVEPMVEPDIEPQLDSPAPPGTSHDVHADIATPTDSEDVVAELEAMFSSVESPPNGDSAPADPPDDSAPDASPDTAVSPPAPEEAGVGMPDAARSPADPEPPQRARVEVHRDGAPPDRPWMIIMAIIVLLAGSMVARDIARRNGDDQAVAALPLLERVESTSAGALHGPPDSVGARAPRENGANPQAGVRAAPEDTGASMVSGASAAPRPSRDPGRRAARPSPVTRDSAAVDSVAATPPAALVTDSARTAAPITPALATPPALPDSAQAARDARDAEIAAIRAEIARRSARLDSIARAVGTLNASPRSPANPPTPPARPVPPPHAS